MGTFALAVLIAGVVLLASMISVEVGVSVALIELAAGVFIGNAFDVAVPALSLVLRPRLSQVILMFGGAAAFFLYANNIHTAGLALSLAVFVGLFAYYALGWTREQAEIAGTALSTTSLAVVYAVLVETGLNQTLTGKRLMSACRRG